MRLTNAAGGWRARKERRSEKRLRPEHDFSVAGIGLMVVCVVVGVMFSV
jgi:hypothetical protein